MTEMHAGRATKFLDPNMGECVCEYCKKLPWFESPTPAASAGPDHEAATIHAQDIGRGAYTRDESAITNLALAYLALRASQAVAWRSDIEYPTKPHHLTDEPTVAESWKRAGFPVTPLYAAPVAAQGVTSEMVERDDYRKLYLVVAGSLASVDRRLKTLIIAAESFAKHIEKWGAGSGREAADNLRVAIDAARTEEPVDA